MIPLQHEVGRRLEMYGVSVSEAQRGQLAGYLALLRQWNAKMNLTTLESGDASMDRLIVEPALAASSIDAHSTHLLDIGSGGGSPAIPLKIMRPDLRLTMVEARARKSVFLREAARHVGLTATSVETANFEDVLSLDRIRPVSTISVRAVRLDSDHLELCTAALLAAGQMLWFLSDSQDRPASLPPELGIEADRPLVSDSRSRVLVLRKTSQHL